MNNASVTNEGLRRRSAFQDLRSLYLANHEIDAGVLERITEIQGLETLQIYNARITDADVRRLARMQRLKHVYFFDTSVTMQGIDALRKALPNCEFVGD